MSTNRRDFLRALACATPLIHVPKLLDRHVWKVIEPMYVFSDFGARFMITEGMVDTALYYSHITYFSVGDYIGYIDALVPNTRRAQANGRYCQKAASDGYSWAPQTQTPVPPQAQDTIRINGVEWRFPNTTTSL